MVFMDSMNLELKQYRTKKGGDAIQFSFSKSDYVVVRFVEQVCVFLGLRLNCVLDSTISVGAE